MMTGKERLHALMKGQDYDRPPFNFYEINGLDQDPNNHDPFHIYSDPSWKPLIDLAWNKTEMILLKWPDFHPKETLTNKKPIYKETRDVHYDDQGRRLTTYTIDIDGHVLTQRTRRDPDVDTVWTLEHLLKDEDDLEAWMKLPDEDAWIIDGTRIQQNEAALGDRGIAAISLGDALCSLAGLFSMEDYTIMAMTNQELFTAALDKMHRSLMPQIKAAAQMFPGHMWRICGPEYAGVPYLPPRLYDIYVGNYDREITEVIRNSGGFARVHQHGNVKQNLQTLIDIGFQGIDPLEPPHQGDVTLQYVRETYGDQLVLFGNLEANDIELASPDEFEEKIMTALREGPDSRGQGFVLQPGAAPYGRHLTDTALNNYKRWVQVMEREFPGTL